MHSLRPVEWASGSGDTAYSERHVEDLLQGSCNLTIDTKIKKQIFKNMVCVGVDFFGLYLGIT